MKKCKRGHLRSARNVDCYRRCIPCRRMLEAKYSAEYRRKNRTAVKLSQQAAHAKNPFPKRNQATRWAQDHPKRVRQIKAASDARRRARKSKVGGSWTTSQWVQLQRKYGNRCVGCGKSKRTLKRLRRTLAPDHVVPIAKNGTNRISNIQPLCHGKGGCNLLKGVRILDFRRIQHEH
jgi:HNH endonuclease